jgi:hypothetical protein
MKSHPDLLFKKGTYSMPLLHEDGTLSTEHEQIYRDVTPFQLALYSSDVKMRECLLPLIPDNFIENVGEAMRLMSRGGPDLVAMSKDPRSASLREIKQFDTGKVDEHKNPITYDLLCNPDGIIYFDDKFFYVNPEHEVMTLLMPNPSPTDQPAFDALKRSLKQEMVINSSRRTSDAEHELIARTLGCSLERNGIHYNLNGIDYQDTCDGGIRLINAYRKYIAILNAHLPEEPWTNVDDAWIDVVGKAQRSAPVSIIQHYCDRNKQFDDHTDVRSN